jgi:cytoskeleton protein RodZ
MHIELEASEPSWVTLGDADGNKLFTGLLKQGETRTIEVERPATLRTGNAGGLQVRLDGKPIGPLGPRGQIRQIEFRDGVFRMVPPE